jgi:hypothetical protein
MESRFRLDQASLAVCLFAWDSASLLEVLGDLLQRREKNRRSEKEYKQQEAKFEM